MSRLAPALLLPLLACGGMAIDGEVVDTTGSPMADVSVTVFGQPCATRTDEKGRFSLTCTPGEYRVVIGEAGYVPVEEDVAATERERYDIGKKVLIKIPEDKGLFLFQGEAYQPLAPGRLGRQLTKQGKETLRAFCLDTEQSQPTELTPGVYNFFDHAHIGWRPFKLDEEGCAYRDRKNEQHQWTVEYREKAQYEEIGLDGEDTKTIARIAFEEGDYFIADWKGFFTAPEGEKHTYTGHWVRVRR